jgi:alkylation response protein AidB-like acyl-CoA dehydrogenase
MPETLETEKVLAGGEFLIRSTAPETTFSPDDFNEEQQMVQQMCLDFLEQVVAPNRIANDKQEPGLAVSQLKQMADYGLLGAHIPEAYTGTGLDFNTNSIISDFMGPSGGFTVTFAVQIGIGMLPIFYFGTEEQKQRYLPDLISAKKIACYCLTEPSSGSDALAAKTTAVLNPEGTHYLLTGQKMWISNAGWADVFIVFAKIDGKHFSAFIVDKGAAGLTLGAEEDKLGIKGSSTRQVYFENTPVPVENLLGEAGKGHLIAFNVLNMGRYKLGGMCLGGARSVIGMGAKHAIEREQFGKSISQFGAIQHKLGEMTARTYAVESAVYRVSQLIQDHIAEAVGKGMDYAKAQLDAAEEYAIECSILKVTGSELLDFNVDENLQIHGGVGFSEEYNASRAYRDSRINRIYEGTNEINRLLIVDMLLRRAMKGELDLVGPAWAVQKELSSMPSMDKPEGEFAAETQALGDFKKIALMVAGAGVKMQMDGLINLKEEQEILMNISDVLSEIFLVESALLRAIKASGNGKATEGQAQVISLLFHNAQAKIASFATDALASFADGDLLKTFLMGIKRYTKYAPVNVKNCRRAIASQVLSHTGYPF